MGAATPTTNTTSAPFYISTISSGLTCNHKFGPAWTYLSSISSVNSNTLNDMEKGLVISIMETINTATHPVNSLHMDKDSI